MKKKRNIKYLKILLMVVTLLTMNNLWVLTIPAVKKSQSTMSCDMGNKIMSCTMSCDMENNMMSCDSSMMTTITGMLTRHGKVFSIGSTTLDYFLSCCANSPKKNQEIHHELQSLVGETITVTGMLECCQVSTMMIFSINGITYRSKCC